MIRDFGCDMRGMLSFQILWLLSKGEMNGEGLAEEIEKRRGEKPKPGTLYPALKQLNEKKLIEGEREGKLVIYSLTLRGEESVEEATEYFMSCFGEIFREEEQEL